MLKKIVNIPNELSQKSVATAELLRSLAELSGQNVGVVARMEVDLHEGLGGLSHFEMVKQLYQDRLQGDAPSLQAYLHYWTENNYLSASTAADVERAVAFLTNIARILQSDRASNYRKNASIRTDENGQYPAMLHRELFVLEEDGTYVHQELIQHILDKRKLKSVGALISSLFHNLRIVTHATETLAREANLSSSVFNTKTSVDLVNGIFLNPLGELDIDREITPKNLTALELEMFNNGRLFSLNVLRKIARFHDKHLHAKAVDLQNDYDPERIKRYNMHFRLAIRQNRVYEFLKYHRDTGGLMVLFGPAWTKTERSIQSFFTHAFPVDEHILQVVRVTEYFGMLYRWGNKVGFNPELDFGSKSKAFYKLLFGNENTEEPLADYQKSIEFKIITMLPTLFKDKNLRAVSHYIRLVQEGNLPGLSALNEDEEGLHNLQAEIKAVISPLLKATVMLPDKPDHIEPTLFQIFNSALFHDIAKGDTPVDHEIRGVSTANNILRTLEVGDKDIEVILDLVSKHNILNAFRQDYCDPNNPVFKLLASQINNPELLLVLTLADRFAGKFSAWSSNQIEIITQKAVLIAESMTALSTDMKIFRTRMLEYLAWKTPPSASDQNIVHRTLFNAVTAFADNLGPLYQSLLRNRPQRVWYDYKFVTEYSDRHQGEARSTKVDIHFQLAPILSEYDFEISTNIARPKLIIQQLIKHGFLSEKSEELTQKSLTLTTVSILSLDQEFKKFEPAILKQILQIKKNFRPHIMVYGSDIHGLSRGIDHFLHIHNLSPERMNLFTGKDGAIVDRIVFRQGKTDQLQALVAELRGQTILDYELDINVDTIDFSKEYMLAIPPFVESTNTQTIISVELKGRNNINYLKMLKAYFRKNDMNITFGEYNHISGSGIPLELSTIENEHKIRAGTVYNILTKAGFIDLATGRVVSHFDPEAVPALLQEEPISKNATTAIKNYLLEVTSPRTRIDFVADDQRREHEINGIKNDLQNLLAIFQQ